MNIPCESLLPLFWGVNYDHVDGDMLPKGSKQTTTKIQKPQTLTKKLGFSNDTSPQMSIIGCSLYLIPDRTFFLMDVSVL